MAIRSAPFQGEDYDELATGHATVSGMGNSQAGSGGRNDISRKDAFLRNSSRVAPDFRTMPFTRLGQEAH